LTINETKYNTLFVNKFKANATQLDNEFNRVVQENGYSEETKLAFYNAVFETLITQFKNEVTKDENYDYIITTLYNLFIKALKEDNIDTVKLDIDLATFKTKELPTIKILPNDSSHNYAPEYKIYNLNTKYGRRKAREQAVRNYENGTPEYKREINNIKVVVWLVVIAIIVAYFVIKVKLTSN
jgi:hypothetical protein